MSESERRSKQSTPGAAGAPGADGGPSAGQDEAAAGRAGQSPTDADSLRGRHFKALMRSRLTWALIGVPAVVIGGFVATTGVVVGLVVALAIVAIGLGAAFAIADSRAADDFFDVYAASHGLELGGKRQLPAATPLLRKGDRRYAKRTLNGEIAPGTAGLLALFTYEEDTTDSEGRRQTNSYEYTLGMCEVAECADDVPELYCRRRSGLRSLERLEDVFRRSKRRVTLESGALDDRYEIFVNENQDEVWLRRLFSPSFIVYLAEEAPEKFAFELVGGTLVAYVKGHLEDAPRLDGLAAATGEVAKRLRDEVAETSRREVEPSEP